MILLLDQPERVASFVAGRTGVDFGACPYSAIGVEDGGRIVAGAVFNLYQQPDITVSVAVDPCGRPAIRRLMRACAAYAFGQLRCTRVSAEVAEGNSDSRLAAQKLGFRLEGVRPCAMPDGSAKLLLGLLADDFRWR